MSKEEFLKIKTCVLKVNIHCDGCKQKVKKILQKIDGVYTTKIDSEQGKVTVSGNVEPAALIKKLTKNGKRAELWGAPKANNNNNNQNQLNNQFKNVQIDNGKGGNNKKGQGQGQKGGGNNQPKAGAPQGQIRQLPQLPQMQGIQNLKLTPELMKDLNLPQLNKDQKSVKFSMPEDEGFTDDEFDEFDDDDYYDDDDEDFEDDMDDAFPLQKTKPMNGNEHGGLQMPNMLNGMMNGQQQLMKGGPNGGGNNAGNNGGNAKKGGGGGVANIPVQMNLGGGNDGKGGGNGGKKGGNGNNNGGNQQGGGKGGKNGGGQPQNGGQNKNASHGTGGGGGAANVNNLIAANGAMKGGVMYNGPNGMPNMLLPMIGPGGVGQVGNMPTGHMGNLPMASMNNLAAVQGLPAMNGGGGGGGGAANAGAGPKQMGGNPYQQQQQQQQRNAMMMNQQIANGNERFQPMMYARPPPAVNYMPPHPPCPYPYPSPYAYPYPPPPGERADQYSMFSDENTSSCTVM